MVVFRPFVDEADSGGRNEKLCPGQVTARPGRIRALEKEWDMPEPPTRYVVVAAQNTYRRSIVRRGGRAAGDVGCPRGSVPWLGC